MATPRKASDYIPILKNQGIDDVVAANGQGVGMQSFKVTQAGAAPLVVNFETLGLKKMANADYTVLTGGETAALTTVDESTITTEGFNVLGGADTEVHHITVVGTLAGQAAPS